MKQLSTSGPQQRAPVMPPAPPPIQQNPMGMAPAGMQPYPQGTPQAGMRPPVGQPPGGQPRPPQATPQPMGGGMDRGAMSQALGRVGQPQAQAPQVRSIGNFGYPRTPAGPPQGIPALGGTPPAPVRR